MEQLVLDILKEETEHYVFHYNQDFFTKAKRGTISFEEHYALLDFDDSFIEDIIYQHPVLVKKISDFRKNTYLNTLDLEKTEEETLIFEKKWIDELSIHFKSQFAASYLTFVDEFKEEIHEDLKYYKNELTYYKDRLYIEEEEKGLTDEPVTEEEREKYIKEDEEKHAFYSKQLSVLESIEKELEKAKIVLVA